MANQDQSKSLKWMWGGIIAFFFIVMIIINQWMSAQVNVPDAREHLALQSKPVEEAPSAVIQKPVYENVVRRT